jgi:uncharacterized membrane protein YqiK
VIREARKDYLKHIKTEIGKFKEKVQAQIKTRKHVKEMDRLHEKTLKQELKDVISFEDFKKQKDKNIQMKTSDEMKIEKEKQKEKLANANIDCRTGSVITRNSFTCFFRFKHKKREVFPSFFILFLLHIS